MNLKPVPVRVLIWIVIPMVCAAWSLFWFIAVPKVDSHTIPYYFGGLFTIIVTCFLAHLAFTRLQKK
jgi:F0F1-type ATP synthase assembly protein I